MLHNYYICSQQPTYLMEFRCNFHFIPVYTTLSNQWHSSSSESARDSDFRPHVIFVIS